LARVTELGSNIGAVIVATSLPEFTKYIEPVFVVAVSISGIWLTVKIALEGIGATPALALSE
jgi:hypothetical protein